MENTKENQEKIDFSLFSHEIISNKKLILKIGSEITKSLLQDKNCISPKDLNLISEQMLLKKNQLNYLFKLGGKPIGFLSTCFDKADQQQSGIWKTGAALEIFHAFEISQFQKVSYLMLNYVQSHMDINMLYMPHFSFFSSLEFYKACNFSTFVESREKDMAYIVNQKIAADMVKNGGKKYSVNLRVNSTC
jgi:hypothetical protein